MDFTNKITIITGGSSGIGLALAKELGARNAFVVLAARRKAELEQALSVMPSNGNGGKMAIVCDVSDPQQVKNMLAEVAEKTGPVDILVNSAGVVLPGYVQQLDLNVFKWMMDINYFGTVNTVQAVLPAMIERRNGVIVNIASFAAYAGVFSYAAYSGSKFAVRGYTEVLRAEMKPYGIQVLLVSPPDTDTPQLAFENQHKPPELKAMLPELGVIQPEQVARAIVRGIEQNKYETFPDFGSNLLIGILRHTGSLCFPLQDLLLKRAIRDIHNNHKGNGKRLS
jgi:3-dehydrosphinganine reductase